jgi:large subunit ribosomal protein L13
MITYSTKKKDIKRQWHLIDLKDQVLGRTATRMASLLIGKNKTYYVSNLDCGDYIVAINAGQIKVTGHKATQKVYRHHTNYPGGLREQSYAQLFAKDPRRIILASVKSMLPDNKLKSDRLRRLKVFSDDQHPYQDKFAKNI